MEAQFGMATMCRWGSLLTAAEYGLSETEYLELMMPTNGNIATEISIQNGLFNFSTFSMIRRKMSKLYSQIITILFRISDSLVIEHTQLLLPLKESSIVIMCLLRKK